MGIQDRKRGIEKVAHYEAGEKRGDRKQAIAMLLNGDVDEIPKALWTRKANRCMKVIRAGTNGGEEASQSWGTESILQTIKPWNRTSKASNEATRGEVERERDMSVAEQGARGGERKVMVRKPLERMTKEQKEKNKQGSQD